MDTKWTPNNGGNSSNPNNLPSTGSSHKSPTSTDSAVKEEVEKTGNPFSNNLGSKKDTTNSSTEHSDSTMSSPVNDKVDTSEKSGDSTEDNSPYDLSYFEGIYKTKEKDPLDLSYFESPYDKNKLEEYLKSNVESGNQLAYTQEDLTEAQQGLQNALDEFNSFRMNLSIGAPRRLENDLRSGVYGNSTDRNEIKQKLAESGFEAASGMNPERRDEALNKWADAIVSYNKQKQIQEDIGRNGPTVNKGMSKAEENALLERAASDYSSLSDEEKEKVENISNYAMSRGGQHALNQPLNPFEPVDSPTNRAISERNERLSNAIYNAITNRDAARRREETPTTPETPATPTRTPEPARTEETSSEPEATSSRTEETSTSPSTSSTSDDDLRSVTEERTLAVMDLYNALRDQGYRGEMSDVENLPAARLIQSDEYKNITSADELKRALIESGTGFGLNEVTDAWARWGAAQNRERQIRESLAGGTSTRTETPRTEVAAETTESETPETPTEVATAEPETTDDIPEEIPEEPSEETKTVMDAMEHLDGRWWEFGSEDYERTRKQIARISPSAEEEFMDFADLINDIANGSAGDKVKAVLKLLSKAAWDTFNILPKVCVDIAKDIVYRLIKGDYDTSGLTEGEQKQVERFSHNRQNVNMMNAMLNTMDKPVTSSIRGKGRGQATDESDYNEGLIEETNDVVSDVTKKYIINHPWIFKTIQRW